MIVRGFPKDTTEDEFLAELTAKNNFAGPVKLVEKLKSYRHHVRTAAFVIDVENAARERLLSKGKVLIK